MGSSIYQQSIDKQRIIITGEQSGLITKLIRYVLSANQRKFDLYTAGQAQELTDAPVLLIETQDQLADYHHHILLLSEVSANRFKELEEIANTTPKGGIIIFPDDNKGLKALAVRERPDVQAIPYSAYKHEVKNGKTLLISSTNEKIPIVLNTETELKCIGAARELLKKIGISSGQFYRSISTFQP